MQENAPLPTTLQEAITYFNDPEIAHNFMVGFRWPDGVVCPRCESKEHSYLSTRRVWKCKSCKKQFSVKVGTIFEDSPISLSKWLVAMWVIVNAKNGVSSYELHRSIGVTQKTAWFMLHRIRLAMQTGAFTKLSGEVEVDETYVGGKAKNMHKDKREEKIKGRGAAGKAVVMGMIERRGEVRAKTILDTKMTTLQSEVHKNVELGSEVFTDSFPSYNGLSSDYAHAVVDHTVTYVDGKVHTNSLENFWSLFKRCINGTYISVEPEHLTRYVDEEVFRFNNRKDKDRGRFEKAVGSVQGRRLTYKELIGEAAKRGKQASH